jgi:DNA-binding response OmpR family regulator
MAHRILVIDDDNNIRLTVRKVLVDAGYEVDVAVDGHHGLEKLSQQQYDVVLLDMKMPDIDGLEVLQRAQGNHASFVMQTGFGSVETAVEAMKLGAVDYLRKPFTPEEIRTLVSDVVKRSSLRAENASKSFQECVEYAKRMLTERNWSEADVYLKKAIGVDPLKPEPWNLIGVMLEMQGQLLEALRMYRGALAVDPSYQPAQGNLARATRFNYEGPTLEP